MSFAMFPRLLRFVLVLLAPVSILIAFAVGSMSLDAAALWRVLSGADHGMAATVVFDLRLPRALSAFTVGGLLALAGTLMQAFLRNPLADPYLLGVSGGAAVGALLALLGGLGAVGAHGGALLGSLAAMTIVYLLSHGRGVWSETRLLLTGVMVAAVCGALITLMLALAPPGQLAQLLFWLIGDIATTTTPAWGMAILALGVALSLPFARGLNLYARGENVAATLGENPAFLRTGIYLVASLLTAAAVTLAGPIGFVGLVVPHALRLLGASDHRRLLIDAPLAGGSLLVLADTLARTLFAPAQLPVGALTALLGAPLFLFLLARGARHSA